MVDVLIEDLDPEVHTVLAGRASGRGQTLEQYLATALIQLASQPTLAELTAEIAALPLRPRVDSDTIVRAIHSGREGRCSRTAARSLTERPS